MKIENFKVFQPCGNIVVDVFEYTDDTKQTKYTSGITYFLDEDGKTGITIMTDVHTDDAIETLEQTLTGMGNLYAMIAADSSCYNTHTGEKIASYKLNELYPEGFDVDDSKEGVGVLLNSKTSPTVH